MEETRSGEKECTTPKSWEWYCCCGCCIPRSRALCRCSLCLVSLGVLLCLFLIFVLPKIILDNFMKTTPGSCNALQAGSSPEGITLSKDYPDCDRYKNVDLGDYEVSAGDFTEVSLVARDGLEGIAGYYYQGAVDGESGRTVLMVHGMKSCKARYEILIPAAMLYRNGFNVLAIDLRQHGESPFLDGWLGAGAKEYPDVLGAIDWLIDVNKVPIENIAYYTVSLGSPAVLIALSKAESVNTGIWFDSPAYGLKEAAKSRISNIPAPFSIMWWYYENEVDLDLDSEEFTAQGALRTIAANRIDGKPNICVVQGNEDKAVPTKLGEQLAKDARLLGFDTTEYTDFDTSKSYSWASNRFPARRSDDQCREHITFMLLDPALYQERLLAFFKSALGA